eukprot:c15016_g1_i1.p1 GENE.c15016_g1_i1~~c15016_g1_i1.p1  ORF type:complete len:343 (+),score=44.31 c15016_g1_i1:42-1070(+)
MCDRLFPSRTECSGHGLCVPSLAGTFLCVCSRGWTGIADFKAFKDNDCDINIETIRIINILGVCLGAVNVALYAAGSLGRILESWLVQRSFRAVFSAPQVWNCLGFLTCSSFFLATYATKVIHGVEEKLIGTDMGITITFVLGVVIYEFSVIAVSYNMTHVTADNRRIRIASLLPARVGCLIMLVGAIIATLGSKSALIAMAAEESPEKKDRLLFGHLAAATTFLTTVLVLAVLQLNAFIGVLEDSVKTRQEHANKVAVNQAQQKLRRFRMFRAVILPLFIIVSISLAFLAFWPFFRSKSSYFHGEILVIQISCTAYTYILMPWKMFWSQVQPSTKQRIPVA